MNNWFTVEQLDNETFVISEYNHWEEPHCYLLIGTERAVLIDTGLGVANIRDVVERLTNLPVLVVTTHVHWDHIGSHKYFETIAVHEAEKSWLEEKFPLPLEVVKQNLMRGSRCTANACEMSGRNGSVFDKQCSKAKMGENVEGECLLPETFCIDNYKIFQGNVQSVFRDGDIIDIGNRQLKVIHTPGHSPGHSCFYEEPRGYLFSGDLIYKGCLDMFYPTTDPVAFWKSIQKIQGLNIFRILPGHHDLDVPMDMISRIEEAFAGLERHGKLQQGSGVFDFGDFQIHL